MKHLIELSLFEYFIYIGNMLIDFIQNIFKTPIETITNPKYLFALGHIFLFISLLIPSWIKIT
jgi:ascorbate-specific PTS system EIIC-type component UlaA